MRYHKCWFECNKYSIETPWETLANTLESLTCFFFNGVASRSMVENLLGDLRVLRMITIHSIPNSWLRMHGVVPPLIGCCCQAQLSDVGRFGGCHRPTKNLTPLPIPVSMFAVFDTVHTPRKSHIKLSR